MKLTKASFAGVVLAVVGVSQGAVASDPAAIYACANSQGNLTLVAPGEACKDKETLISWNIAGPQGAPGPSGVVEYYVAYAPFPGYSTGAGIVSSTALCDAGDMATGGGWSLSSQSGATGGTPTIRANGPKTDISDPALPIGWTVVADVYSDKWAVPARAICADLTP